MFLRSRRSLSIPYFVGRRVGLLPECGSSERGNERRKLLLAVPQRVLVVCALLLPSEAVSTDDAVESARRVALQFGRIAEGSFTDKEI